ncbi:hypothetical protein [Nonomuraea sp. NEAU-A123]|uniref:hypothetical protein n=1 Tax=Nonomuraea sp. NEAU-A123 TaxID=2839649 RepID=UPI001BE3F060|nr:hypothetical protein [Nonomuraea sp. NEAU-A123]
MISRHRRLRALTLDTAIRAYLDQHPAATVVALGEGLQTTYWRLGGPASTGCQWICHPSSTCAPACSHRSRA